MTCAAFCTRPRSGFRTHRLRYATQFLKGPNVARKHRWMVREHGMRGNVSTHKTTGCDDTSVTDAHTRKDDRTGPDPYIITDLDAPTLSVQQTQMFHPRRAIVVNDHNSVPQTSTLSDANGCSGMNDTAVADDAAFTNLDPTARFDG